MFGFEEVSLEELEKLLYQNTENSKSKKELLIESIAQIGEKMGKCQTEIIDLANLVKKNQMEEMYARCSALTKKISNIATSLGILPAEYGIKDKKMYINKVVVEKKEVEFIRGTSDLHIILPELLPHRPQYDVTSGKMRYVYDIDKWRAGYYNAFSEEFMYGKYKIFGEKVCMLFINHVERGNETDVDNLEYKIITDIITLFLLVDDSHRYLSHYMDMIEDERNYTEIIICPQSRIGEYLK